jgi:urease accessory protein
MPPSLPIPLLTRRGLPVAPELTPLRLPLTAAERVSLRGRRRCACGTELLLQLPRGAALQPGEWLGPAEGTLRVCVEAAPEPLLAVRVDEPLALVRAAYHLGNRHVALQVLAGELRLAEDPVLADLLRGRGLTVEVLRAPFEPEPGAYGGHDHGHGPGDAAGTGAPPA